MAKRENGKTVAVYLSNEALKELEVLKDDYIKQTGANVSASFVVTVAIHALRESKKLKVK
jgi:hypothetical protein